MPMECAGPQRRRRASPVARRNAAGHARPPPASREAQEWLLGGVRPSPATPARSAAPPPPPPASPPPAPAFLRGGSAIVWARAFSATDERRCECDTLRGVLEVRTPSTCSHEAAQATHVLARGSAGHARAHSRQRRPRTCSHEAAQATHVLARGSAGHARARTRQRRPRTCSHEAAQATHVLARGSAGRAGCPFPGCIAGGRLGVLCGQARVARGADAWRSCFAALPRPCPGRRASPALAAWLW
jgi:hypothetical protein